MPKSSKSLEELKLEAKKKQLELELVEANLALMRKRAHNDGDDSESDDDVPAPSRKKARKKSQNEDLDPQSDQADDHSDNEVTSDGPDSHVPSNEYYRDRQFSAPPPNMICTRPSGYFNPETASPWGLRRDHDGYLLFLRSVRELVKVHLDRSIGWNSQNAGRRANFTQAVKNRYPILRFQHTPFTITTAASNFLSHKKEYSPKEKESAKSLKKREKKKLSPSEVVSDHEVPTASTSTSTSHANTALLNDQDNTQNENTLPPTTEPVIPVDPLLINDPIGQFRKDNPVNTLPVYCQGDTVYEPPDMHETYADSVPLGLRTASFDPTYARSIITPTSGSDSTQAAAPALDSTSPSATPGRLPPNSRLTNVARRQLTFKPAATHPSTSQPGAPGSFAMPLDATTTSLSSDSIPVPTPSTTSPPPSLPPPATTAVQPKQQGKRPAKPRAKVLAQSSANSPKRRTRTTNMPKETATSSKR